MAHIISIGLVIFIILSSVVALILLAKKNPLTHPFVESHGKIIKESIAEQLFLPLGGTKQWISLRGINKNNPILIFLHGGPGISLHALFRYFHHDLENHFLIVGWDQRGTGKSYNSSIPPSSMNIDTFISDLKQLVDYLKKRFNKNKVYILGESWGSLLGILYSYKYPEDVAAYIGTGQITNMKESEKISFEFTLSEAKKRKNKKAITELSKIQQPSGTNLKDLAIQRKWLLKFGGALYKKTSYLPWILKLLSTKKYSCIDVINYFRGQRFSLKFLWKQIFETNFFKQISKLNVPVYFLLGKHDNQVSSHLAQKYFNFLKAPKKKLIWFENSGHNPMFEEPEKFNNTILKIL
ncbi:alpha/beta fold hydrolase [Candidatus Dependentiae bacterium]|nr:alpha/beta fold hydrolase [Candidatus Dependentiae bacterium]